MQINRHELALEDASADMQTIFALAEQTRQETYGYFDIRHNGMIDPSGIVKGWAIYNAADILRQHGLRELLRRCGRRYSGGRQERPTGQDWRVGIRNPFNLHEIVKVLAVSDCGVATSGTYDPGAAHLQPAERRATRSTRSSA